MDTLDDSCPAPDAVDIIRFHHALGIVTHICNPSILEAETGGPNLKPVLTL
jgi:hypothetical protein